MAGTTIPPSSVTSQNTVIHALCRCMIAFVWIYHGLVPKLIVRHVDEVAMIKAMSIPFLDTMTTLQIVGWGEVAFGLIILLTWHIRHMLLLNIVIMAGTLVHVAVTMPAYLSAAFNPVTLNLLMITLSFIGFIAGRDLKSASR